MATSKRHVLRRVIDRRIQTYATIREMLECGHAIEVHPLADPLIAKLRHCDHCERAAGLPPKKVPSPVSRVPRWRREEAA